MNHWLNEGKEILKKGKEKHPYYDSDRKKRTEEFSLKGKCILYCWNGSNINYSKNTSIMAIVRWFINLFWKDQNNLSKNLEDWDDNFMKGKLKKGRRFR